jgi:acetolactate synthase I/II/III large subunit
MATTVEVMVEAFQAWGTPFIVGHPGGESVDLMEAARVRNVRFILMKQESAGAMLAATWGEITGSPGVCMSTRAPGAANMVNGVTQAWMDRSPLIAITDQYPATIYETGLRQRLNALQLYAPITKWNSTIHASTIRQQMRRAVRTATAPPQGPVQFDFPANETRLEAAELPAPVPLTPDLPGLHPDRIA